MMKNEKSQLALEFVMLLGFLILIMGVVIMFSFEANRGVIEDNIQSKMEDFTYSLQSEILLAAEMNEGYVRQINVPATVENTYYNISVISSKNSSLLYVNYTGKVINAKLPKVYGTLTKGNNYLRNINGEVFINTT